MTQINPWKVLGLREGATDSEIKKAFRKLAKKYHPDKGGNGSAFAQISQAFALIATKEKRRQFTEDGGVPRKSLNSQAIAAISGRFCQILSSISAKEVKYHPIVAKLENSFREDLAKMKKDLKQINLERETYEDLLDRFIFYGTEEEDFISTLLKTRIGDTKRAIKEQYKMRCVAARAIGLLKSYEFRKEMKAMMDRPTVSSRGNRFFINIS